MPTSAESGPSLLSRDQRYLIYALAAGLVACVILAIPTGHAASVRDLAAELKTFGLCYTVLIAAVWGLVRKLPDDAWRLALVLFFSAMLVRLLVLVWSVDYAVSHGRLHGVMAVDDFIWSQRTRAVAMMLSGKTYGLERDIHYYSQYWAEVTGSDSFTGLFHYTSFNALIVVLCGYSAVAHGLTALTIGSYVPVAVYAVCRRHFAPAFAVGSALWAAYAPGYVVYGVVSYKDTACTLIFIGMLGLAMYRWPRFAPREWVLTALLMAVSIAVRANLHLVVLSYLLAAQLNWRLPRRLRWIVWLMLLAVGMAGAGSPTKGLSGLILNFLAVPALSWMFTPVGALETGWLTAMPLAPFWPLVVCVTVVGVYSGWHRMPDTQRLLVPMALAYMCLIASEYIGNTTVTRLRLMVEWAIGGSFYWTLDMWRTSSPALRIRAQRAALILSVLMYLAFLGYSGYRLLR